MAKERQSCATARPHFRIAALALGLLALGGCDSPETPAMPTAEEQMRRAKAAAQAAFEGLSGELMTAMGEGGPPQAISVCATKANLLTSEVASEHGVRIVRLSDRSRNPAQQARGEDLVALEAMRKNPEPQLDRREDGSAVVRLPIVLTNPICLKCHGGVDDIDADTAKALDQLYPDDRATGYSLNDLRGLWRIELPVAE